MRIVDRLNGKKILIWGYGKEGKSTESFINKHCNVKSIDIYVGDRSGINDEEYDLIIKSPGIPMLSDNTKYTSDTELFLDQFRDKVIGVTGTKGKSTTSSLLYKVLKECYSGNVLLLGNIGRACLDYVDDIRDDTIIVYEMSCHQLAHTKVSPHIAVLLNIYEEHLDYYRTFENYFDAKRNITTYQSGSDYFIVGDNVPYIETSANVIRVNKSADEKYNLKLLGEHNQYNANFVYTISVNILGLDAKRVCDSMSSFNGLAHRLEYIGVVNGVSFYDDSISTIPEATIDAVKSIPNIKTVLIGGKDRNISYEPLIEFIRSNSNINFICSYESGERIYRSVKDCVNCSYVPDLYDGVKLAKKLTGCGDSCVLSPAAASYGYFKNFEERGDVFRREVFKR